MPLLPTISPKENRTHGGSPVDVDEAIRRRAYQFYEQRGYVDGYDMEDWLLAEQEIKREEKRQRSAAG